jgi:spore coat protein CotF
VAKVGMSNEDRTISLKAAVHSCINKQQKNMKFLPHFMSSLQKPITECNSGKLSLFILQIIQNPIKKLCEQNALSLMLNQVVI